MPYSTLIDIIAGLDSHQRRELYRLSQDVDGAEPARRREAKRTLYAAAQFFIELTWERMAPGVTQFSLEAESGRPEKDLKDYLVGLQNRQPAFAWGWIRSKMNGSLMRGVQESLPNLLAEHAGMAAAYQDCLNSLDYYWFRQSPMHHLKAGYHTALSVACKWYGSAFELLRSSGEATPQPGFRKELRAFATCSMTVLARTDGWLWDSAGAEPMDLTIEGGVFKTAVKQMEELDLASAPDFGARLGCPALRARSRDDPFAGIVRWVEEVFGRYLV